MRLQLVWLCLTAGAIAEQVVFSSRATSEPSRPLPRGDIEIFATTDTHGWLRGHLGSNVPEPNYSGGLGALYSFLQRYNASATDRDVLLVDSGDTVDGNGLVDADPGVKGASAREVLKRMPYDLLTLGNHELYRYDVALDVHLNFVPHWRGRYLASNVDILRPNESEWRPFASRYRRFTTPSGVRVLSFGVLFSFPYAANGLRVQPPQHMAKEPWFEQALDGELDLFVLVGHMPVGDPGWDAVLRAIRARHPTTPMCV